jgi:hypothetical protein
MRSRWSFRALCRPVAGFLALGLLLGTVTTASADTRTQISAAQQRLAALESQIASEQAAIVRMHASLMAAVTHVEEGRRQFEAIQIKYHQSQREREAVDARYRAIRAQIANIAATAYMQGPPTSLQNMINPQSVSDATAAMEYAGVIMSRDSELADRAHVLGQEVKARQDQEDALLYQRGVVLTRLTDDQNALANRFDDERLRLARLADARAEVATLLVKLRTQLRAEEIAAALAALAGGISFGKWATAFLGAINAPITRSNLVVIVAWETAEFTSARWNPLATTYPMPGATAYNDSGVRNYVSLQQGLQATVKTLSRPGFGYEAILSDLAHSADPMTTAQAINDSSWCGGCADGQYVVDLIPSVEKYYDSYARASA